MIFENDVAQISVDYTIPTGANIKIENQIQL